MTIQEAFENFIAAITGSSPAALNDSVTEESSRLFGLLMEALKNPEELFIDFQVSLGSTGVTLSDMFKSVIIDHGKHLLEEYIVSLRTSMKKPIGEILDAVSEASEEALDDVIKILISPIARNMTAAEIAEAKKIYGSTFNYDKIYFSEKSLTNDIVFGVQDWFTQNPNSRAFVTMILVNFDVNDGPLRDDVMIHELCHVYQYHAVGPVYALQAIHAQLLEKLTGVSAYNYGFTDAYNGDGGGSALSTRINSNPSLSNEEVFETFNREQQAQIIQHYYVRRYVESRPEPDYAPWQPFQDVVQDKPYLH